MRIGGRVRSSGIGLTARRPRTGEPRPALPRTHRPAGTAPRRFDPAVQAVFLGVTAGVAAPVVTTPAEALPGPGPADVAGFEAIAREILFSPAAGEAPPERLFASPEPARPAVPGAPAVPAEASALFRAVLLDTLPFLRHGTVPAELYLATHNLAAETVAIDPRAIFERMGELIENAEHDIAYQTYNWDIDSDPVRTIFDALERLGQKRALTHPHGPPVAVRSKNMDTQSWNHSREVGVMVDSRFLTKKWIAALFAPDWARSPRAQPSPPSAPATEPSASGTGR